MVLLGLPKHIVIQTKSENFANATVLYSYILTLHKKVTLYCEDEVHQRFAFLPWYDKIKPSLPSSAEYTIVVGGDTLSYYDFFNTNNIKLNSKMATGLYAALYEKYEYFSAIKSDGILFATLSKLVESGANCEAVEQHLYRSNPLSLFRIKATLYQSMLLVKSATEVELFLCDADLKASGASIYEVTKAMQELLTLAHVKKVVLKKSDQDMKVIKEIEIVK